MDSPVSHSHTKHDGTHGKQQFPAFQLGRGAALMAGVLTVPHRVSHTQLHGGSIVGLQEEKPALRHPDHHDVGDFPNIFVQQQATRAKIHGQRSRRQACMDGQPP